jgi:hypothetical protein
MQPTKEVVMPSQYHKQTQLQHTMQSLQNHTGNTKIPGAHTLA